MVEEPTLAAAYSCQAQILPSSHLVPSLSPIPSNLILYLSSPLSPFLPPFSQYKSSPTSWLSSQRSLSPLTIFSKSYCPYSKKAKNLLHSLGANYQVYEIDLREDGEALQPFLAKLSGHRTFPTVFLQDTLIGGWDDLEKLRQDGILEKLLREAGAV